MTAIFLRKLPVHLPTVLTAEENVAACYIINKETSEALGSKKVASMHSCRGTESENHKEATLSDGLSSNPLLEEASRCALHCCLCITYVGGWNASITT